MHYSFSAYPWQGTSREIPFIEIEPERGDDLPPLEKAFSIEIDGLTDDVKWSTLRVIWVVWFDGKKRTKIKASFNLNNENFKKSMKACGTFAEEILDYVSHCPKKVEDREVLEIGGVLEESDIVGDLKVMIDQIRTWRNFLDYGGTKLSNVMSRRHETKITKDGYYMLVVDYAAFPVFWEDLRSKVEHADDLDIVGLDNYLFDFDPGEEPPEVNIEYICWKRPETKILVVPPHELTRDAIIDHYDYRGVYNEFLKKQEKEKEAQESREAAYNRIRDKEKEEEEAKKGGIKKELRGILLA